MRTNTKKQINIVENLTLRRVIILCLAFAAIMIFYFGFETWLILSFGALVVFAGLIWIEHKIYPTT